MYLMLFIYELTLQTNSGLHKYSPLPHFVESQTGNEMVGIYTKHLITLNPEETIFLGESADIPKPTL